MEMELTRSMLLFYGGLAGAGISVLGALITAVLLRRARRRITQAVRREYQYIGKRPLAGRGEYIAHRKESQL